MWLRSEAGEQAGTSVEIAKSPFVVGREEGCDLVLADPKASRRHAQLEPLPDGRAVLTDLGSTNGTFVNGVRIAAPAVLEGGEEVRFADTVFTAARAETETEAEARPAGRPTVVAGPLPTEPPPQQPPPPPAPTPSGARRLVQGRNKWIAVAVTVAVFAGAGAGIGIALSGEGDEEATPAATVATTAPVTTAPVTTAPVTIAPVTTAVTTAPVTMAPDADGGGFPDASEQALLAHVPEAFRSSCERQTEDNQLEGQVAGVFCSVDEKVGTYYNLFPDLATLTSSYDTVAEGYGPARDTGDCATDERSENRYTMDGQDAGRYVCFFVGSSRHIVWTDDLLLIRTDAYHTGGDKQALYDFWLNEAGPVR